MVCVCVCVCVLGRGGMGGIASLCTSGERGFFLEGGFVSEEGEFAGKEGSMTMKL